MSIPSPALLVCVAYIHIKIGPTHAKNVLNALRSDNPNDALLSVYGSLQHGNWAIEYRLQEVVDYIRMSLKTNPQPTVLVGTVVRLLTPPPTLPEGYVWSRTHTIESWHLCHVQDVGDKEFAAVLPLGSVYCAIGHGRLYRVVGVEGTTFADFDGSRFDDFLSAYNVGQTIVCAACEGFDRARLYAKGLQGADYAERLIDRMCKVVEG